MRHVISFLLSLAFMVGGGPMAWAQEPMLLPTHPEPLLAETAAGERSFTIEIADTAEKRARGLMFRRSMGDDHGMLFVFEESRNRSFWMKDTPMPLDLLFVGEDGSVRAIERGEPLSTDGIAPDARAQFVLELKAGTAQRTGIEVGDRLRHPLIDAVAQND
ncbi:DUF192 domain-containing protein [Nitratireductor sp. GCM10026969]|uniref:DUF192 domain-containing protein n=1 Tax=Nitratireductor sp. GCM10026969 TaxID=3252645 RepID=UPI00361EA51A